MSGVWPIWVQERERHKRCDRSLKSVDIRSLEHNQEMFTCLLCGLRKSIWQSRLAKKDKCVETDGRWLERKKTHNKESLSRTKVRVRIEGEYSEPGQRSETGLPTFTFTIQCIHWGTDKRGIRETDEGVKVGGKIVKALRFADDQAML